MTARPLPFFKRKLMSFSRDLYLENGWTMPRGIEAAGKRDPTNFSLAEWQRAKRQRQDPRWIKQTMQECWSASDNAKAFRRKLLECGYFLGKGDKRGFVVIGFDGEVHSLPRALGVKTKEVAARLGDGSDLDSVADIQSQIAATMRTAICRHIDESRALFRHRSARLDARKELMTKRHREARVELEHRHQAEWLAETKELAARLPRGLAGLWSRITGRFRLIRRENEAATARSAERHKGDAQALADAQLSERQVLQMDFKTLRQVQANQLRALRREVGCYLGFVLRHPSGNNTTDIELC